MTTVFHWLEIALYECSLFKNCGEYNDWKNVNSMVPALLFAPKINDEVNFRLPIIKLTCLYRSAAQEGWANRDFTGGESEVVQGHVWLWRTRRDQPPQQNAIQGHAWWHHQRGTNHEGGSEGRWDN